jgi:hypothetical protein
VAAAVLACEWRGKKRGRREERSYSQNIEGTEENDSSMLEGVGVVVVLTSKFFEKTPIAKRREKEEQTRIQIYIFI